MSDRREVWITGIGLLTCLGEGVDAAWAQLERGDAPSYDDKSFAPYIVHPLGPISFDKYIPKKSDQRQMETWQRVGVYSAGMALADAGIAGNPELLDRADMIIAAGGGERDIAVDTAIMAGLRKTNTPGAFLNERLMSDLRPTLLSLAQAVSNLLASWQYFAGAWRGRLVAHIHGRGSSRRRRRARGASAHRGRPERADAGRGRSTDNAQHTMGCAAHLRVRLAWPRLPWTSSRRCGTAARMAASPSARWARSWCSKARSTRPRAAPNRGRKSRKSIPTLQSRASEGDAEAEPRAGNGKKPSPQVDKRPMRRHRLRRC